MYKSDRKERKVSVRKREKEKLLRKIARELETELSGWARDEEVISKDQTLVVSLRILSDDDKPSMNPVEFFSKTRLVAAGLSRSSATRANHCIMNACVIDYSTSNSTRRTRELDTIEKFLEVHGDVDDLFRIKNLGRICIPKMVKMIRGAGLQIADFHHLVD